MAQRLIDTIWGSTGNVTEPTEAKRNLGWIAEIPAHDFQNWWQDRMDEQMQYVQQAGIGVWLGTVTYLNDAVVMYQGVLYQSIQAANTNHLPSDTAWWTAALASTGGSSRGYINGMQISNNAAARKLNISSGICRSQTILGLSFGLEAPAAFIKDINEEWTEGTNLGGRASALSLTANTWYRVFALGKQDGTTDYGFDAATEPTATNLLIDATGDGYDYPRQVGWVKTDGSSNIKIFRISASDPDYIMWLELGEYVGVTWGTTREEWEVDAPPNTLALIHTYTNQNQGTAFAHYIILSSLNDPDIAPAIGVNHWSYNAPTGENTYYNWLNKIEVNDDSEFGIRDSRQSDGGTRSLQAHGYWYKRNADTL